MKLLRDRLRDLALDGEFAQFALVSLRPDVGVRARVDNSVFKRIWPALAYASFQDIGDV